MPEETCGRASIAIRGSAHLANDRPANAIADFAPAVDAGSYAYEVRTAPATLVVRRVTTLPVRATAGRLSQLAGAGVAGSGS